MKALADRVGHGKRAARDVATRFEPRIKEGEDPEDKSEARREGTVRAKGPRQAETCA